MGIYSVLAVRDDIEISAYGTLADCSWSMTELNTWQAKYSHNLLRKTSKYNETIAFYNEMQSSKIHIVCVQMA